MFSNAEWKQGSPASRALFPPVKPVKGVKRPNQRPGVPWLRLGDDRRDALPFADALTIEKGEEGSVRGRFTRLTSGPDIISTHRIRVTTPYLPGHTIISVQ